MIIVSDHRGFEEARGLVFKNKEILKAMHVVISDKGLDGFLCIMDDASTELVPKSFFEEQLKDKLVLGVE